MAISDKTRKTLWARSGNRCAMCRAELVAEKDDHSKNLNLGDECHIVSEKGKGPRYREDFAEDFDGYNNLILLCKNHHRTIDELFETYTEQLLRSIKYNHEAWVKKSLDDADSKQKQPQVRFLNKISGKDVMDIVIGAHAYKMDHEDLQTQEEVDAVGSFLGIAKEYGEFGEDLETSQKVQIGFDLNRQIEDLKAIGFSVFGERKRSRMVDGNKKDLGMWEIATVIIVRNSNPSITQFGTLTIQA
jgi:hypothetical protein